VLYLETVLYDITTAYNALNSLSEYLDVFPEDILNFMFCNKDCSLDKFLDHFNINKDSLLDKEIYVASLHVTTNNDKCSSLEKYGLRNLRDAIQLDTPVGLYLRDKRIDIDFIKNQISYKSQSYDISGGFTGFGVNHDLDLVLYKLFDDYQINGFFSDDNVLDYGGGVKARPEFLHSLAELLKDQDIEYDWIRQKTQCYVLKYKADLSKFANYTFDIKKHEYYEEENYIELKKRLWLVKEGLNVINDDMFYDMIPERYSYMNFDVIIPYSDIVNIYTSEEYEKTFVKKDS